MMYDRIDNLMDRAIAIQSGHDYTADRHGSGDDRGNWQVSDLIAAGRLTLARRIAGKWGRGTRERPTVKVEGKALDLRRLTDAETQILARMLDALEASIAVREAAFAARRAAALRAHEAARAAQARGADISAAEHIEAVAALTAWPDE